MLCPNCVHSKKTKTLKLLYCNEPTQPFLYTLIGNQPDKCKKYTPKVNLENRFPQVTWLFDEEGI